MARAGASDTDPSVSTDGIGTALQMSLSFNSLEMELSSPTLLQIVDSAHYYRVMPLLHV